MADLRPSEEIRRFSGGAITEHNSWFKGSIIAINLMIANGLRLLRLASTTYVVEIKRNNFCVSLSIDLSVKVFV